MKRFSLFTLACLFRALTAQAVVYLTLTGSGSNQVNYSYDSNTGVYSITTTGGDPYVFSSALSRALAEDETHLVFEYKCSRTISSFQIYFGNSWAEDRSRIYGNLTSTAGQWREMDINLSAAMSNFSWGQKGQKLRLDFGFNSGYAIQLRNIQILAPDDPAAAYKRSLAKHLEAYLATTDTKAEVESVEVKNTTVVVRGHTDGEGPYALVEIPLYQDATELTEFVSQTELTETEFEVTLPRHIARNFLRFDRLLSRWAVVSLASGTPQLVSHARCADDIYIRYKAPLMKLQGKKGLGGFWMSANAADLDALGIKSVTINVVLTAFISTSPTSFANYQTYSYAGRSYYIDQNQINNLDATLRYCTSRGIVTSAILLISPDACPAAMKTLMIHPECDGGYYSMANMTTLESTCAYAAIISFLAERYSKNNVGRINHWILHNEVDFGKEWTNMGDQPVLLYMDAYYKSLRLVSAIARQYDQNAWVLGSFTHSWTSSSPDGAGYNTRNMLGILNQYSAAEGDFPWGVALHPYPQDLTQPSFWVNDQQSTYQMSSPYCTFKNLEVIDAWARDWDNYYLGQQKRLVFLSENGTNSRDYGETQLRLQAAGACWAWKKTARLDGIDAIQWHNWQDNRAEFGLRIGLRRYTDDETDPNGCKPAWYVWQAAETDEEETVFQPYMATLGITSWDQIFNEQLMDISPVRADATSELPDGVYTLDGRLVGFRLEPLPRGIYIVRQQGRSRKIMR